MILYKSASDEMHFSVASSLNTPNLDLLKMGLWEWQLESTIDEVGNRGSLWADIVSRGGTSFFGPADDWQDGLARFRGNPGGMDNVFGVLSGRVAWWISVCARRAFQRQSGAPQGQHAVLFPACALAGAWLCISTDRDGAGVSTISSGANPAILLLKVLGFSATLPLLMVSATAPLLQCWLALTPHPRAARSVLFVRGE